MKQTTNPGRPLVEGEKQEKKLWLCVTESRWRAYLKAAGPVPVYLWVKRALDREAKFKP